MIVNEIAKFENPLQRALQLLLVAELGEPLLVIGSAARRLRRHWPCRLSPDEKVWSSVL